MNDDNEHGIENRFTQKLSKDDIQCDMFVTVLDTNHGEIEYEDMGGPTKKPVGMMQNGMENYKGKPLIVEAISYPYVMVVPLHSPKSISVDMRTVCLGELSDQYVGACMAQQDKKKSESDVMSDFMNKVNDEENGPPSYVSDILEDIEGTDLDPDNDDNDN